MPGAERPRDPGPEEGDLTARTASGLRWSYLGQATLLVATLAYTAVISRLLDPAVFGVYALATLVVWFLDHFARMGLASAIVQKPELTETDVRAASTAGIVLGLGCCALTWVVAPLFAAVFHMPPLTHVMRVLSIGFVFEGWSMTGMGLLIRELRFRELSIITAGTYVLGYLVVGVSLAAAGAGVWSLVIGVLVSNASQAVWQYAKLRHPVRPVVTRAPYAGVCGYGARLSGTHVIDYLCSSLDTLVVARVAPSAVLGQYNRAYSLAFQPIGYHVAQASTNVLFSSLSRIQEDLGRLRRFYVSGLTVVAVIVFPVCAGMSVAATELVRVVLGSQWGLAAGLVPWFAFGAGFAVLCKLSRALAEARAELTRSLAAQGVQLAVLGILLLVSAGAGKVWLFAASVAISELARLLSYLGLMRRILALNLLDVTRALMPALFASAMVALAVAGARQCLLASAPTVVVFVTEVAAGAATLVLCLRLGPMREARAEVCRRLDDAGLLGRHGGRYRRFTTLVFGRLESGVAQARES